jgi:hypothetical protein
MAIAVRTLAFVGEATQHYYVTLWSDINVGPMITVHEDEDLVTPAEEIPLDDMRMVGRKVRRLAKWAETPKGKARIEKQWEKEVAFLARPVKP